MKINPEADKTAATIFCASVQASYSLIVLAWGRYFTVGAITAFLTIALFLMWEPRIDRSVAQRQ